KFYEEFSDPSHGFNPFDYGYVGKFETQLSPVYAFDSVHIDDKAFYGWVFQGLGPSLVTYTPGTLNPLLTNYTTQYFDLVGDDPVGHYQSIFDIENGGGLINGDLPISTLTVYSMWLNTGYPVASYGLRNNDQFHFGMNAS